MAVLKKNAEIAVIGDGGWGTTLALLCNRKGYRVRVWGPSREYVGILDKKRINPKFLPGIKIPRQISFSADIGRIIAGSSLLVLAVPSHFLRGVLEKIKNQGGDGLNVLSAVKGIETDTLMRMSEVIREVLGKCPLAVLSGPTISYEVARGIPTTCVVASRDADFAREIQSGLMSERFRIYSHTDVIGVELGGALKNVIAIACGISDGLGFGANTKAAILARGLVEISLLGCAMGARAQTFSGLSGLGDLVTTCISSHGRNRWVGEQIGRGRKLKKILQGMEMVAEGVKTARAAVMLAEKYKVQMPITAQVYAVLYQGKSPKAAVNELMLRQRKDE